MKTTLNFLIVLIFSLMLPHQATAYVFSKEKDRMQSITPPQYEQKKTSFLDRLIAKHVTQKLKKSGDPILDIDLMAQKAKKTGIASLFGLLGITLFGLGIIAAPILGIAAIHKANLVLNHPDATTAQKTLAKKGKTMGIISIVVGGVVLLIIIFLILIYTVGNK